MPFSIEIDAVKRRILTCCTGHITGDDLFEYYEKLRKTPGFSPRMDELFDLSDVGSIDLTSADIVSFSRHTQPSTRQGETVRVAVVAPTDLAFGLSRMYELLQSDSVNDLQVFRDQALAVAWLDEHLACT